MLPLCLVAALSASLNVSSIAVCKAATDVCGCSELAPGCGWCSSSKTCEPASSCTTTCRECPARHDTCRSSCRRKCIDTCAAMTSVCGCAELDGCGWCSHAKQCSPYPECSTTCEECDSSCANYKYCQAKCYKRFRPAHRDPKREPGASIYPLLQKDINCAASVFLATVLASAAGIGGGAVLVPLYTLLGEFTEHEAIPLSIATVFGASTFSTLGNFLWLKHPQALHRPLIAYDAVLALLPATLLGSTAGVFFNKLCPNWLIMVLLVLLCAYSGQRTVTQAFKRREKEDRERSGGDYKPVQVVDAEGDGKEHRDAAAGEFESAELAKEIEAEGRFPWGTMLTLARTWLVVLGLALLKGGHGAPSLLGVKCGTAGYYGVVLLNVPVLALLSWSAGRRLIAAHLRKVAIGYLYAEGDVQWDSSKVLQYPSIVAFGAIAAGLLGVGGGMILGPIFNELEFQPQVSSATSTIMVFFMSSATVGQFVVFGMLDLNYALFYGTVGVAGAVVGTKGAKVLIDRTGRASYLIFFLAAVLLGSGVLMAATGVPQILQTGFTGFRPLCGRAGAAERQD